MWKKIIGKMILLVIILCIIVFFGKNIIAKYVLENKLSKATNTAVKIDNINVNLFSSTIEVKKVYFKDLIEETKNKAYIEDVMLNYELHLLDKRIIITDSSFLNAEIYDLSFAKKNTITDNTSNNENKTENNDLTDNDLGSNTDQKDIDEIMKASYDKIKKMLAEKRRRIEERINELQQMPGYTSMKENIRKILDEKNPLILLQKKDEIEELIRASKELGNNFAAEKGKLKEILDEIKSIEQFDVLVDEGINSLVDRRIDELNNIDQLISSFLTVKYGPKLSKMEQNYREILAKMVSVNENKKNEWEIVIKRSIMTLKAYGLDLSGEIAGSISSVLRNNAEDTIFRLTVWDDNNNGIIEGKINLEKAQGNINYNLPNVQVSDVEEFKKYVNSGGFGISGSLALEKEKIRFAGKGNIQNIGLTSQMIDDNLNVNIPLLKEMIVPALKEVRFDDINYSYDPDVDRILINSDIGQKMVELVKNNDLLKKSVINALKEKTKDGREKYHVLISNEEEQTRSEADKAMDNDITDIINLSEKLEKIRSKDKSGILEKILKKF